MGDYAQRRTKNDILHDNLQILEGINNACIDLIYLDPPFNKKKTFSAPIGSSAEGASFDDTFREEDMKDEWVKSIEFENQELYNYLASVKEFSTSYNYCYLVYMAIRLIECHRILQDTGSLYLHCDPTMSHYLKIALDCIFGEKNFRNEIIWWYDTGGMPVKDFARKHDVILRYSKSKRCYFSAASIKDKKNDTMIERMHKYSHLDIRISSEYKHPHDVFKIHAINPNAKERTGLPYSKTACLVRAHYQGF